MSRSKRGPRVVAADGSGDFRRLSDAVPVGYRGRVLLRPGDDRLPETLLADGLRLEADGPRDQVRIIDPFRIVGGRVLVCGISLSGGVSVEHAQVVLRDCLLAGPGDGIEVAGPRSRVKLVGCRVTACARRGVSVNAGATVRLIDCVIDDNGEEGVYVGRESWVRLQGCRVASNRGDGVHGLPDAKVLLRRCVIESNGGAGVRLEGTRSVITRCDVISSSDTGLYLGDGGVLILCRSRVAGGRTHGLRAGNAARALLRDCALCDNDGAGLTAAARARLHLRRCTIEGNRQGGVRLARSAHIAFASSASARNADRNWDVEPGAVVTLPLP
jgi:hypothetical protein